MDPANQNQQTGDNESKKPAVKDEALAAANQRILKAEVRAAASGKLTDPADALRYLDLSKFTVTADGGVDTQAIADSIGELLEQKPYLGKAEQAPSGANITPPSGTRDGDRHQGQLTRDDLKTMSPAEIVKAQQDGRLNDLLGAN